MDLSPIILTFKLAGVTTLLLFVFSVPVSMWLANSNFKIKPAIEALISMPLVLPPTVLGFYLLVFLSPSGSIGGILQNWFNIQLIFSFEGLILASMIYSMPFMIQALQAGFEKIPKQLVEAARLMGKSRIEILRKVQLPNMRPAILTGLVLSFAHTIGEFGVVLMIGGNIPNETRVVSIAIYDQVEAMNYSSAGMYSGILFTICFVILLLVYSINGGHFKRFWK